MLKKYLSKLKFSRSEEDRLIIDSVADISDGGMLTEAFGIRVYDGSIAPFSQLGESYPASGSYSFSTNEDMQDQITIEFHKSSELIATENSYIGTIRLRGYKLEAAGEPMVRVHYELSNNQISIWARNEKKNGKVILALIKNKVGESVH